MYKLRYCKKCRYPSTKPDLIFDSEGVCNSCRAYEARANVNWAERERQFREIMDVTPKGLHYDCVVPVSGGKDSFYQVIKLKEMGYNPLAVNAGTCDLTPIGRRNLDTLATLCDLIEVVPNKTVRKRINRYALETIGDISWPEHVLIFTAPVKVALQHGINLVIWGENPQNEYGGPLDTQNLQEMKAGRWLQEFGGLNGLRVIDLIDEGVFDGQTAQAYIYPTEYDIEQAELKQLFLGQFFDWDGVKNAEIAQKHGFEDSVLPVETHGFHHENLDNYQTGIHDYFKYLKYGFGRATDLCCTEIKRGRMTRDEAKQHIQIWERLHKTYLNSDTEEILKRINVPFENYIQICNIFANKNLFNDNREFNKFPTPKFNICEE